MRPLHRLSFCLALAGLLLGQWPKPGLVTAAAPLGVQAALPRFEPAACPFPADRIPPDERVECGYLVVLEDRAQPAGRTLRLAVAILKSFGADPAPDPVVFLSGGPGIPALQGVSFWLEVDRSLRARRDLILLDQRGTGYSEPDMRCPEFTQPQAAGARLPLAEATAAYLVAVRACRDRLRAAGLNLAAYHSSASAADLADLRTALGYDEWNLYGLSYGGRLALTTLREQPAGLRSAILDSPRTVGVKIHEARPGDTHQAFQTLFAGCAADPECAAAFPQLEQEFYALVERLNAAPLTLSVPDPATGAASPLVVTGDQLVGGGFDALYDAALIPYLPLAVHEIHDGNVAVLTGFASALGGTSSLSQGMMLSVVCHEETPFSDPDRVQALLAEYPRLQSYFEQQLLPDFAACAEWGAGQAAPNAAEPVRSDIPTLVMTGEYDPIHPPWWGQLAADHLSRSYHFTVPGQGHGVTFVGACVTSIRDSFLDEPTVAPDASCLAALPPPDFVTDVYLQPGVLLFAQSLQQPDTARLGLLGLILLVFVSALVAWPVAALVQRRRRPALDAARVFQPRTIQWARWLAIAVIAVDLLFLIGLVVAILNTAETREPLLLFGLPPAAAPLFVLPWLAALLTAVVVVLAAWLWRTRAWSPAVRVHYTLVALAAVGYVALLVGWKLLGI